MQTQRSVYDNAKSQGLSEAQALQVSNQFIQNGQQVGWSGANTAKGENWGTELQKAIDKLVLANAYKSSQTQDGTAASQSASTTHIIKYQAENGQVTSFNAASVNDATVASELLRQLATARSSAA